MKRTSLTNLLIFISFASVSASCGGEQGMPKVQTHIRLQFSNYDQYFSTLDSLSKMSDDQIMEWEAKNNFYSLRTFSRDHRHPINLPEGTSQGMSALLNPDMEVKIGNSLVWVDGIYKYAINDGDELKLQTLKREPNKWNALPQVVRHEYKADYVSYERYDLTKTPNAPSANNFAARGLWPTFWWNGGEFQAQIWGYCDERDDGWGTVAKFGTSVSLNYCYRRYPWNSCSWRPAGENFRKEITKLTLEGSFPYIGNVKIGPLDLLQVDNTPLDRQLFEAFGRCWMFTGSLSGYYNLKIDGSSDGPPSTTYTW